MKALLLCVTSLILRVTSGQVCCAPFSDYQAYITLYLGMADVVRSPVNPEAYVGRARRTTSPSQRLEMTEYYDWQIPGFENTRAVISDARQNPGTVYTVMRDGSCTSEQFSNMFITPPCVPPGWTFKETMQLGSSTIWDRYGDDNARNYLVVERSTCIPVMQLATRKNAPTQGLYRFNTEYYYNATQFTGTINIPTACLRQSNAPNSGTTYNPQGPGGVNTIDPYRGGPVNTRQPNVIPGITTKRLGAGGAPGVTQRFGSGPETVTQRFGAPAPAPGPGPETVTQRFGAPAPGPGVFTQPPNRAPIPGPPGATQRVNEIPSTRIRSNNNNNNNNNGFTTPRV